MSRSSFEIICDELTVSFGQRCSPSPSSAIPRECKAVGWQLRATAFAVLKGAKGTLILPWQPTTDIRHYLISRVDSARPDKRGRSTAIAACSSKLGWSASIAYLDIWTRHDLNEAIKLIERLESSLPLESVEPPMFETESIDGKPVPMTPVLRAVMYRDQGRCALCGSRDDLQFDHILPRSHGGADSYGNLRVLCRSCNLRKSDRS
jgi:hypothetical protein